ncbi:MAG TPA: aminotransferase class IV [Candidatus Paceibacterota bacterium]|nr:aminotransferase class IV [Candidatus Paceibacterota bacterium]
MPSFDYSQSQAFFRDGFVPFKDANVSIASSPVLYGLSIYTVFGVNRNGATGKLYAFRLKDHYARLVSSAKIMDFHNFAPAWPYERFEATMLDLVRRNAIAEDTLVRVTVFVDELIAGTKIHGLTHSLSAYAYPMGSILPRGGVNLCVSSWTRNADNAIPPRAKVNGSYANTSLIKNEAVLNGYDDAIVLDAQGHVTEGTVANIFLVRGGRLVTPSVGADLLEGITRDSILRIARDLGLAAEERTVDRSELYLADEAFLCGSSARVIPIVSIDKRPIGTGAAGTVTQKLAAVYGAAQTGIDPASYAEWRMEI